MVKVSIIVPVFNGERFLEKCLDSVVKQSLIDIEIIIVDNGSTDQSGKIIESFINKWFPELKIIYLHETRRGNSFARNTGMHHALGEYITFVDQDDFLHKDFLAYMYNKALETDADVVVAGYRLVRSDGTTIRNVKLTNSEWAPYRVVAPWGKIFKRSLIEKKAISFLPVNKGEDVYFVLNAYNSTEKVYTVPITGYNWLANSDSFSHTAHRQIDEENSILPLFDKLQDSLYPLKNIKVDILEYFLIKAVVHETFFCAKGKGIELAYGYYEQLQKWMDIYYPNNEHNKYVGLFTPRGEDLIRRIFVSCVWHMKKRNKIKEILKLYVSVFK